MGVSLPACCPGAVAVSEQAPDAIPAAVAVPDAIPREAQAPDATQVRASTPVRASIRELTLTQVAIPVVAEAGVVSVILASPVAAQTATPDEIRGDSVVDGFRDDWTAAVDCAVADRVSKRVPVSIPEPVSTPAQAGPVASAFQLQVQAAALPREPVWRRMDAPLREQLSPNPVVLLRAAPLVLDGNPPPVEPAPIGHRSPAGSPPPSAVGHDSDWRTAPDSASPPAHCCAGPAVARSGVRAAPRTAPASDDNSIHRARRCS